MKKDNVKEKGRVMAAMGVIAQYICDEDILEWWLPWGIEDEDPEFNEVLADDFDAVAATFAKIVRVASKDGKGGWLFIPPVEECKDGEEAGETRADREELPVIEALKAGIRHAEEWARAEAEAKRKLEEERKELNRRLTETGRQKMAAILETGRLRDLIRRMAQRLQMARLEGFGGPERETLLDEARKEGCIGEEAAK